MDAPEQNTLRKPAPEIPGYSIISELGSGGMATVYLAIQENFGRKVALKVMSPALAVDETYGERFMREARIAARFSHPNIIAVYDVGVHNNHFYIAMEYHSGGDLKFRIRKKMAPRMAMVILRQMAAALDYAHIKGYIHRDVKPDNILFRDDGSAVLTDFGIARPASGGNTQMTQIGMVVGTPKYMSPEQARGKELDARSDIYSLGIVFYEMLTGKVPFEGEDSIAIGIQHVKEPVPPLPEKLAALQPIIDKLLAKTPEERYNRGKELANDLDRLRLGVLKNAKNSASGQSGTMRATPADRAIEQRDDTPPPTHENRSRPWLYTSLVVALVAGGTYLAERSGAFDPLKRSITANTDIQQFARSSQVWLDTQGLGIKLPATLLHGPDWQEQSSQLTETSDALAANEDAPPAAEQTDSKPALVPDIEEAYLTLQEGKLLGTAVNLQWHPGRISTDGAAASASDTLARSIDPGQLNPVDTLADKLDELLTLANQSLAANRLSQPAGNNAVDTFRSVLMLDPNNEQAIGGLARVADAYVGLADKAITAGSLDKAATMLALGEGIEPGLAAIAPAKKRLAAARDADKARIAKAHAEANRADTMLDKFRITGLLRGAEYDIGQAKLTAPAGDNALEKYREVLQLSPGNTEARKGIRLLAEKLGQQLNVAIDNGDREQADKRLSELKLVEPGNPRIAEAEAAIAEL